MNSVFEQEKENNIGRMGRDTNLWALADRWISETAPYKYSYNFTWLGRPIIQFPQDILAMQEIIWRVRPRLIVETGIAHGGSLVFYASMLELAGVDGRVLGVDVEIRPGNRAAIEEHPLSRRISMIQGSSVDEATVRKVFDFAAGSSPVLVALDSSHTHTHVLRELQLYSPLVSPGSYLVVFDTTIEDMPAGSFPGRLWDKGNNPKTAVREFLCQTDRFVIDRNIDHKLLISAAREGYLLCMKDLPWKPS